MNQVLKNGDKKVYTIEYKSIFFVELVTAITGAISTTKTATTGFAMDLRVALASSGVFGSK